MMAYIIPVLGFLFVFGMVVFVHEFGHFSVAKWYNVQVDAFALGMGPVMLSRKWGETEYRICWLPLGGYVKLAGEEDPEKESDNPRSFYNQSVWARTAVLVAGAACNILLGYVLYVGYGMYQGEAYQPPIVGYVAQDYPADGKLKIGDRLLSINGYEVETFQDILIRNELLGDKLRTFVIERNGKKMILRMDPRKVTRTGFMNQPAYVVGIDGYNAPVIDTIMSEGEAQKLGFREGDRILRFDDQPVESWSQFQHILMRSPGQHSVVVEREGARRTIGISLPDSREDRQKWISRLGVMPPFETRHYGFFESFGFAMDRTIRDTRLMVEALYRLLTGQLSLKTMSGPVGIITMTGTVATLGIWPLIRFTAFFSINLGILNLLPVPVLDGGHILLSIPEMITGQRLPDRVMEMANRIGLTLLLTLLILVTFVDLTRFKFLTQFFNWVGF